METRHTKTTEGLKLVADGADGNPAIRKDTMISLGEAAWRVLQNARKAAIARKESADAQARDGVFEAQAKVSTSLVTPKPGASAEHVEDPATIGRSRNKRSTVV